MFFKTNLDEIYPIQESEKIEKKHTILVVDDEPHNLDSYVAFLEEEYDVLTAHDGQDALELVANDSNPERFHLIISDQRMPRMTGVEFFKKVIPIIPRTIRIILTGFSDMDATIEAINEGEVYKFLTKPIEPRDLVVTVQRALEVYELEEENIQLVHDLKKTNLALQQADKLKDDFLSNTSHELKTPLSHIINYAQNIKDDSGKVLSPEALKSLDRIEINGHRLTRLINDILDVSKIKNEKLPIHQVPLQLEMLVRVVLDTFELHAKKKGLKLVNHIPDHLPLIYVDKDRLEQVLTNLIENAIKFTSEGTVTLFATTEKDMVKVSISDTGIGVPPDQQRRIFETFEQVDRTITRAYEGAGLGLSITKSIIDLLGGTIDVESEGEQGTTFNFTLPIAEDQNTQLPETVFISKPLPDPEILDLPHLSESELAPHDTSIQVLVVDDEEDNLNILKRQLTLRGYGVKLCKTGEQALEFLETQPTPHLILLDIMMPKMSGYEVCKKVREKYSPSQLPILFLSARSRVDDVVRGFELGGNDYLTKPFNKEELFVRIEAQLALFKSIEKLKSLYRISNQIELLSGSKVSTFLIKEFKMIRCAPFIFNHESGAKSLLCKTIFKHASKIIECLSKEKPFTQIINHIQKGSEIHQLLGEDIIGSHLAFFSDHPDHLPIFLYRPPSYGPFDNLTQQYLENVFQQLIINQENVQKVIKDMMKYVKQLYADVGEAPVDETTFYVFYEAPYSIVVSTSGKSTPIRIPLSVLANLYPKNLIQVNQSYLINPAQRIEFQVRNPKRDFKSYDIVLSSPQATKTIPIGVTHISHLQKRLPPKTRQRLEFALTTH